MSTTAAERFAMAKKKADDEMIPGSEDEQSDAAREAEALEARQREALAAAEAAASGALVVDEHRRDKLIGDDWSDLSGDEALQRMQAEGVVGRVLSRDGYVVRDLT